jgi:energy-coupling factor transporter ATP-binding protein EcfA2
VIGPNDPDGTFVVSGQVTTAVIQQLLGTRLLLHAGAIAHPELGTVLVVGPSGAGKSTSTTALGQSGTYLTDELTILDPHTHRITAHPKPVSRVVHGDGGPAPASGETPGGDGEPATDRAPGDVPASHRNPAAASGPGFRHKRDLPLTRLGLRPGTSAAAPAHVLLLDRQETASDDTGMHADDSGARPGEVVSAQRIPHVQALHTLVAQSSSTWRVDGGLARLTEMLDDAGGALTVRYTEAADLATRLPVVVDRPRVQESWRHVPGRSPEAPPPGHHGLAEFADAVVFEDSVAVLREGQLVTARGLGALLWDILEADGPCTSAMLLDELIPLLGDDPRAAEHLEAALAPLRDEGLLAPGL